MSAAEAAMVATIRTVASRAPRGATGELRVRTQDLDANVYLDRGRLAWATSSRSRFSLGREIARRSPLSRSDLRAALAEAMRERLPLGKALARASIVHLDTVRELLRAQIADALSTITTPELEAAVFVPQRSGASSYDEALTFALEDVSAVVRALEDDPARRSPGVRAGERTAILERILAMAMQIDGALACCIVDGRTGSKLASAGGESLNLDAAAAGTAEIVSAKRKTMRALGMDDRIEDMLITLGKQYHVVRPLSSDEAMIVYLVLDKRRGNLALARHQLSVIERVTLATPSHRT